MARRELLNALKNKEPVYIHYYDQGGWTAYNLTEAQYGKIDDGEVIDQFLLAESGEILADGYAPDILVLIADGCGFEVGSD